MPEVQLMEHSTCLQKRHLSQNLPVVLKMSCRMCLSESSSARPLTRPGQNGVEFLFGKRADTEAYGLPL